LRSRQIGQHEDGISDLVDLRLSAAIEIEISLLKNDEAIFANGGAENL